jgi:hypothetical protein
MEEEFIQNQERLKPTEEKTQVHIIKLHKFHNVIFLLGRTLKGRRYSRITYGSWKSGRNY